MIEDIAESLFRGIRRFVVSVFLELIFEYLCYFIGWPIVKIFTLGKYPKGLKLDFWLIYSNDSILTSCVGLVVLVLSILVLFH